MERETGVVLEKSIFGNLFAILTISPVLYPIRKWETKLQGLPTCSVLVICGISFGRVLGATDGIEPRPWGYEFYETMPRPSLSSI
jgi:hypothetical protein